MQVGPRNFLSKGIINVLVLIGIVMFFVGLMLLSSMAFVKAPSGSDSGAYERYNDTLRGLVGGGRIVIEIGGLLACIGLVCGGISAEDVDAKIRTVMVSAGVAMIIATLVVLGIFSTLPIG